MFVAFSPDMKFACRLPSKNISVPQHLDFNGSKETIYKYQVQHESILSTFFKFSYQFVIPGEIFKKPFLKVIEPDMTFAPNQIDQLSVLC